MSDNFEYKIGDHVVYPAHGVGTITGQESHTIGGVNLGVYVISFDKDKMTLRVPIKRASASGLRHLSGSDIILKAIDTLKGKSKPGRGMWSRRAQEYEGKINSGDILLISEVVRDLHKNVDDPDRSYSERIIYESALNRLSTEYSAVENVDLEAATTVIESVLKKRLSSEKKKLEDAEAA